MPRESPAAVAHRHAAEERDDQIHDRVGRPDLRDAHRALREEILDRLPRRDDGVAQREGDLRQREHEGPGQNRVERGEVYLGQRQAHAVRDGLRVELEDQRVDKSEADDEQPRRQAPIAPQREHDRKPDARQDKPLRAEGGDVGTRISAILEHLFPKIGFNYSFVLSDVVR